MEKDSQTIATVNNGSIPNQETSLPTSTPQVESKAYVKKQIGRKSNNVNSAPTQQFSGSFSALINAPGNILDSSVEYEDMHLVPDLRNAFYLLSKFTLATYHECNFTNTSMVSPSSLTGYFLMTIYAKLLFNDLRSEAPSFIAQQIANNNDLLEDFRSFENVPVPAPVAEILRSLSMCATDGEKTTRFIPSLGLALFDKDAGYLPPPAVFIAAHNRIVAVSPSENANYETYASRIITNTPNRPRATAINHIVNDFVFKYVPATTGTNAPFNAASVSNTFMTRAFDKYTEPFAFRSNSRRPLFEHVNYHVPTVTDPTKFNYYVFTLMMWKEQRDITMDFLNQCADFIVENQAIFKPVDLKDTFLATNSAFMHKIGEFDAPTFNGSGTIESPYDNSKPPKQKDNTSLSITQYAHYWNYGKDPKGQNVWREAELDKKYSSTSADLFTLADAKGEKVDPALHFLRPKFKAGDPTLGSLLFGDALDFQDERHQNGYDLIFSPTRDTLAAAGHVYMSGLTIYNNNVDSISVRLPNPRIAIAHNKRLWMHSMLPISEIFDWFTNDDIMLPIYDRQFSNPQNGPEATWSMYLSDRILLPALRTVAAMTDATTGAIGRYARYPFGSNGGGPTVNFWTTRTAGENANAIKQTQIWSSYRWTVSRRVHPAATTSKVYFMPTMIPVFGFNSAIVSAPKLYNIFKQ